MGDILFMKKEGICIKCGGIRIIGPSSKEEAQCRKCATSGINLGRKHSAETKRKHSEGQRGENNPFFGRHHSDESKEKIGKYERSDEIKQQARESLQKNRRDNKKTNYMIWIEKYGKKVADEKQLLYKKKQSILNSGENNHMFGRPSPQGSGNGWSGWLNGHFFRSLFELSYLVYMINNNIQFESGETKKHCISYELNGKMKNYYCDFYLIETDQHIEIKPSRLCDTVENIAKFSAAKKAHQNFKVLTEKDFIRLSHEEIVNLYRSGNIVWMKRYEEKFKGLLNE